MRLGRVLHHDQMLALQAAKAQLGYGRGAILKQTCLIGEVRPGPGNHPTAVQRSDIVFVRVQNGIEQYGGNESFLSQQGFDRLDPNLAFTVLVGCQLALLKGRAGIMSVGITHRARPSSVWK